MPHSRPVPALFGPLISPRDELAEKRTDSPDDATAEQTSSAIPSAVAGAPRTYVCPGEKHAIPRSVHLARLAAFYPNCRLCEHRHDTGQLPRSMIGRLEETARRFQQESPFRVDGVRGAYLNHLSRSSAAHIASAVAQRLWSARPLSGRVHPPSDPSSAPPARRTAGPAVVIGQDSRASSADLCVGISTALKRMGCDVIDIGRVNRPCLVFAVEHLQAAAGLYVTGCGCPDSWTGLDVVGEGGIPWSMNGTLADIERRTHAKVSRPTRQGGTHRFFDAAVPYRASLLKSYQEVPAIRILCVCPEPTVLDTLTSIFDTLPCELISGEAPTVPSRCQTQTNSQQPVVGEEMQRANVDWSVLIDESGGGVQLIDRSGQPVTTAALLSDHLPLSGMGSNASPIAVGPEVDDESRRALRELGRPLVDVEEGAEAMARTMQRVGAAMGVQSGGRLWFPDPSPRCDAAVTLGRLLQSIDTGR